MDIADHPGNLRSLSQEETLEPLRKGKKVSCVAKLPRRAFLRGEEIPVTLEIDNNAGQNITYIKARVVLRGKGRSGSKKSSESHSISWSGMHRLIPIDVPIKIGNLNSNEAAADGGLYPSLSARV